MRFLIYFTLFCLAFSTNSLVYAEESAFSFKSTSSNKVRMRYGPSKDYPVKWVYTKKGLPFKVVNTYDNWYKVEDVEGQTGWIFKGLLSNKKTALVITQDPYVLIRKKEKSESRPVFRVEPMAILNVKECSETACKVSVVGYKGYIDKKFLWGIVSEPKSD